MRTSSATSCDFSTFPCDDEGGVIVPLPFPTSIFKALVKDATEMPESESVVSRPPVVVVAVGALRPFMAGRTGFGGMMAVAAGAVVGIKGTEEI